MKKILSVFAAGLLALGLVGCSGDLHDSDPIDFTKLFLRGDMNGWGTTPLVVEAGENYDAKVTFTATVNPQQFAIATPDESWTTAYRMDAAGSADCVAFTADDVAKKKDATKDLYAGSGMSNATIETTIGADYTLYIKADAGFIKVFVEQGEIPLDCYVAANNTVSKMELKAKNNYKYVIKSAADGSLDFSIFDGSDVWGIDAATVDTNLTLSKNKSISLTGLAANKDYVITLNTEDKTAPVVKVVQDVFSCFVIGDITKGEFIKMDVLTETGFRGYTFVYGEDMTAWGGGNGKANFIINDINAWAGNTKLFAGVACDINGDYEEKASDDNATVEGLVVGHTYTLMVDISDTSAIQAKIVEGPVLWITGGMDSWGWTLPPLEYDEEGAFYKFTTAISNCEFKVKTQNNWDNDADTVFADATVTTTATPAGAGSGNGVVTAAAGDKLYVWYDYDAEVWMAKLKAKN